MNLILEGDIFASRYTLCYMHSNHFEGTFARNKPAKPVAVMKYLLAMVILRVPDE